jgi:hypothetical protein
MTALSILLGKVLGLYFIIMALWVWHKRHDIHHLIKKIGKYPSLMLFMGPVVLIAGLFMVLGHNLWVGDWRVVVTISGWLMLFKGAGFIFAPKKLLALSKKINEKTLPLMALIMLIIGVWVTWGAFSA